MAFEIRARPVVRSVSDESLMPQNQKHGNANSGILSGHRVICCCCDYYVLLFNEQVVRGSAHEQ
jgi:hypothetical protein